MPIQDSGRLRLKSRLLFQFNGASGAQAGSFPGNADREALLYFSSAQGIFIINGITLTTTTLGTNGITSQMNFNRTDYGDLVTYGGTFTTAATTSCNIYELYYERNNN